MTNTTLTTPFENDIDGQAAALRAFAASETDPELAQVLAGDYERVILTGMGSSHSAALPTWRSLVAAGTPVWWVDSSQLLESPGLVTDSTLLVATSQSGASGEVVALLDATSPQALVGVTNDLSSPLAQRADARIGLHSGDEATVSTKSYLNTLAAHDRLRSVVLDRPAADVTAVADVLDGFDPSADLAPALAHYGEAADPRLVYVGFGDAAATAMYSGLITKEGAKVPAEGFIGGQFRHGPLELAGPGLVAVIFTSPSEEASVFDASESERRLTQDLLASGAHVVLVGPSGDDAGAVAGENDGRVTRIVCGEGALERLAVGAVVAQFLTVGLARARGVVPGAFNFGSKVTTAL